MNEQTEQYDERTLDAIKHIPGHMQGGAARYIEHGIEPGGFLTAVFENDLHGAANRADIHNLANLGQFATMLHHSPMACWGDKETVQKWMKRGGLRGHNPDVPPKD